MTRLALLTFVAGSLLASAAVPNLVVVFTSDHGDLMGEHDRHNKGVPYETSAGQASSATCARTGSQPKTRTIRDRQFPGHHDHQPRRNVNNMLDVRFSGYILFAATTVGLPGSLAIR